MNLDRSGDLDARKKGKGVLILTAHLGHFEFAPYVTPGLVKRYGAKCFLIRKTLKNSLINRLVIRHSQESGCNIIPAKGAIALVRCALAKNDIVFFALDQHASIDQKIGIAVEFFGQKAGTYCSLAVLSKETGTPVIPMVTYRLPNGRHVVEYQTELEWIDTHGDPETTIAQNTRSYNQVLEQFILAHPDQWYWLYRRWKLGPFEEDRHVSS